MTAQLANDLEKQYPDLNFRNHCYLRIAYDNVLFAKWDTVVNRPFTKNANQEQINFANFLLTMYIKDKHLLLEHNRISLTFRNKL
jgi:hypothetical protein